jgi:hypothetical protein
MIDALMESVAFAAMFSGGMFLLAGIAAVADMVIGRPQSRRPRPVEPVDFTEALKPPYRATRSER